MAKKGGRKKERREDWKKKGELGREQNKAEYTTASVACSWAKAVMRKLRKNVEKANVGPTYRPTNQRTDEVAYRGVLKVNQTHGRMNVLY